MCEAEPPKAPGAGRCVSWSVRWLFRSVVVCADAEYGDAPVLDMGGAEAGATDAALACPQPREAAAVGVMACVLSFLPHVLPPDEEEEEDGSAVDGPPHPL